MNSNYLVDPDGVERNGCLSTGLAIFAVVVAMVIAGCCLCSCSTQKHVEQVNIKDSTVYNYKDSTIYNYRDSINVITQHVTIFDSTGLQIQFAPTGGTYNAKTGEATNVLGVKQTDTHNEKKDSTAFYKSRYEHMSHTADSLKAEVSNYAQQLTDEKQVPKRSAYDKFCSRWFWITAILLLLKLAAWVMEKIPVTAPYIAVVRKFIPFL